ATGGRARTPRSPAVPMRGSPGRREGRSWSRDALLEPRPFLGAALRLGDRGHERMVAPAPHVAPRWRPRDRASESDWLVEPDAFGNAVGNRALSHELGEVPPRVVQDRLWPCLADGSRD